MKMKNVVLALGLCATLAANANGIDNLFKQQQNKALVNYRLALTGDKKAIALLKESANNGDRWAAFQYGYLAQTGQMAGYGGKPSYAVAMKAYNLATKVMDTDGTVRNFRGNYLAAYNMGLIYYYGWGGVPKDCKAALGWFQSATYKSSTTDTVPFFPAAIYAGQIYRDGCQGVNKDPKQAFKNFMLGATRNEPLAMYEVGMAYWTGNGTDRDEFLARYWLKKSADLRNKNAILGMIKINFAKTRFTEPNWVEGAKWLIILSELHPEYLAQSDTMLARLKPAQKDMAIKGAVSWLKTHHKDGKLFDYNVPYNDDTTK